MQAVAMDERMREQAGQVPAGQGELGEELVFDEPLEPEVDKDEAQ